MSSKHLINSVGDCVSESLSGFSVANPQLKVDLKDKIAFDDANIREDGRRVGIISGGGSGHEPFPSGYVGTGMLTASVSGMIFASPSPKQILRAIRLTASKFDEVLMIVPNYTGDVLNFGLASEMAIQDGIPVESIVVGEDVAQVCHGIVTKAGKRGTCGLVLVAKIAGYLAQKGKSAKNIKEHCLRIGREMASIGLCLKACRKPGTGILFRLEENEMELGVGVHGEAGVARMVLTSAKMAVEKLLFFLKSYLKIQKGDELVVLINNLGSLTHLEQWLVAGEVYKLLTDEGIRVIKLYANYFFTSLDMHGVQICFLKISESVKTLILEALDHPTDAPAWPKKVPVDFGSPKQNILKVEDVEKTWKKPSGETSSVSQKTSQIIEQCLVNLLNQLIDAEEHLNRLDAICGDGDCGTTFKSLAEAILFRVKQKKFDFKYPFCAFNLLSEAAVEVGGGTTGAVYGLFFRGISKRLENCQFLDNLNVCKECWRAGVETIKKYSSARLEDRTMLDALEPGCIAYEEAIADGSLDGLEAFKMAVKASKEGCLKTKFMKARAGRASYTDPSKQTEVDAGAEAVTIWLSAIFQVLEKRLR